MKKAIAALIAFAAIVFPQSAIAQYNQPHIVGSKIYFPNLQPSQKASIESLGKTRTPSANKCGIASASITASNPWTAFSYGGQTYQLANLQIHTATHVCKVVNGVPVIYIPLSP
jgi:hypothetical protein